MKNHVPCSIGFQDPHPMVFLLACTFNICLLYLKIGQTILNTLILYFLTWSYFTKEELKGSLKYVLVTHNRIAYKITPIALYIAQRSVNGIIFQMGKNLNLTMHMWQIFQLWLYEVKYLTASTCQGSTAPIDLNKRDM